MPDDTTHALDEALQALRSSEEQYRTLVANLPGVVYRCAYDANWTMSFMSDAVESLIGYPASEFIDNRERAFADVIHPDDRQRVENVVGEAIENHSPWSLDYRVMHRDGRVVWLHERGRGVRCDDGNIVWLDGVLFDITERRTIEAELRASRDIAEEAARARGDFLARMSHELRTPMNAIIGLTELALREDLPAAATDRLTDALRAARAMLRGVDELLDLSSIDARALTLAREPFHVGAAVEYVVSIMRPKAERRRLSLSFTTSADVDVLGDRGRFIQVLSNLLSNALKFTETGGVELAVNAKTSGDGDVEVIARVADTGPGVGDDPEAIEALFSPFMQVDGSGSRANGGVGLGLTLARRIAHAMGGDVSLTSRPVGGALATLQVVLPRSTRRNDPPHAALPDPDLCGLNVLLVDDNDLNRRVARAYLQIADVDVTEAGSAHDALRLLRTKTFDVVLMDLHMPGMDGFEAMRRIRADETLRTLPIVTLSALVSVDDRRRADDAGADAHVAKPFDANDLYRTLARVRSGRRQRA